MTDDALSGPALAADDDRPSPGYAPRDTERYVAEEPNRSGRTAFARDRARVLHSASFRRLAAKTQIHVAGTTDFPRTRLTHTLEVAQIGRELGAALGCDPDLVDVAGLAHDLGHPPFGHNGEAALDMIAADIGGFEGNAQTLRVLTRLEAKSFGPPGGPRPDASVGLNLTRATLDAAGKYPWVRRPDTRKFGVYADDADVFAWVRAGGPRRAALRGGAGDGLRRRRRVLRARPRGRRPRRPRRPRDPCRGRDAGGPRRGARDRGGLRPRGLRGRARAALQRLVALPFWPRWYAGTLRDQATLKNLTSRLIGRFCTAAESATRAVHGSGLTRYAADLEVPSEQRVEVAVLKAVANRYVMQRPESLAAHARQRELLLELAAALRRSGPVALEPALRPSYEQAPDDAAQLRVLVDQIASLTDTSVVEWHQRLCT